MLKATIKHALPILLLVTLAGLIGCSTPEEKRAEQLSEARELAVAGENEAALSILEALAADFPNDPDILYAIGRIYASEEDFTMAAFFLEQAQQLNPDDIELLFQTYRTLHAAGQPSGTLLTELAERSPESMTDQLWLRLGEFRAENEAYESALNAYLKGADLQNRVPDPETSAAIGRLFARLGNFAQAERWLEAAANSDDPNALTALFGLLEIQLRQKRWAEAEATIERLDKQFPGAVDASQWAQARVELQRWRDAQEAMKAKLAEAAAAKAAEEAAAAEAAAREAAAAEAETAETAETAGDETELAAADGTSDESEGGGKSAVVDDLAAAEAMANRPAEPAIEPSEAPEEPAFSFNPDIAIEPADPDFTISVAFDQQALAPETSFRTTPAPVDQPQPLAPAEAAPPVAAPPARMAPPTTPQTVEELLAEAEMAEIDRDYRTAIRKYWAAISVQNNRADVWNLLSRAYLINGQRENAEVAALEAIRLEPNEVAYTLDYLRVAQRTKPAEQFLSYLETAYDRFPASPEITLSLARAHERISQQREVARNLYQRFIDIAPNHPLVPEARDAVARLR